MPTPRPDSAPVPGADQTVQPGPDTGNGEETVRLEPPAAGETRTLRLNRDAAATPAGGPDTATTIRFDGTEADSATFLDPRVWGGAPDADAPTTAEAGTATPPGATASPGATLVDVPPDERPLAPGELRRFGPGVPPRAAAVWHGQAPPAAPQPRRPRRTRRWLVAAAAVLAVLAFLLWRLHTPALVVTGVAVTTDPAGPGCGGTAVVTAAVETNGGSGTVRYRWLRSDGTASDEIVQDVRSGVHHTDLVLRWSFEGQGTLQATATLQILSPAPRTAAATFAYHCP
ncbi:hypothetical protein [Kitasatospora aureofaciens]|uniref:hypothetical protein n=1 Tax=Kitasatospora aureofaciens TaxID=1894 RepID=UPI001C488486|nr:hypothetical protein [Kitasatospora aureofaciens]MBV6700351.1 hypothetical protein [Kitasatospora aureofaciens]